MKKIFSRSRFSTTFFPGLPAIFRVVCVTVLLIGIAGCPDEKPVDPPPTNPLQLTVEDVTCTEASLKLSLAGSEKNRSVVLKRSDSTIAAITIASNDSLFVDEGLLPNKTYTYKLTYGDWIATAQATTMDTTSHDWTWQIDTLGTSASVLVDVAIVNDTLVYAVGEIHTKDTDRFDSLGNWVAPYNVAKWDGKKWNLIQLKWNCRLYYPNCGPETMLFSPATSVFAFGPNDVWISSGSVHHYDGINWREEAGIEGIGGAGKIWGTPTDGLWFVGSNGFIAYRSPTGSWQKMESETTLSLVDIDGSNKEPYAAGINVSRDAGVVLKYNGGLWEKMIDGVTEGTGFTPQQLFKTQLYGSTDGVWVDETGSIYTVGNYMYRYKLGQWNYMKSLPENHLGGKLGYRGYLQDVDGNGKNDMFIAGQRGTLRHFNGNTWTQVGESFNYDDVTRYWYSITVRGNLAVAVGSLDGRARVMILRRK